MTNNKIATARKQTYPFKTMQVGDTFTVKKAKYNSMLTAYRYHNNNFDPIVINANPDGQTYTVTRTA